MNVQAAFQNILSLQLVKIKVLTSPPRHAVGMEYG
jgi:hypothetical protein